MSKSTIESLIEFATRLTVQPARLDGLVRVVDVAVNALAAIGRDVFVEAEIIEQPRRRSLKAHHRRLSGNQPESIKPPRCALTAI